MSSVVIPEDRDKLSRFLLGQLSASESEKVEARIFTDRDFFSSYEEVEQGFVRDYAKRKLDSSTMALFERNYLVTNERRRQVDLVRALLEVKSETRFPAVSAFAWFRRPMFGWAMAGVAAVGVILGLVHWQTQGRLPVLPKQKTSVARVDSPPSVSPIQPSPETPPQQSSLPVKEEKRRSLPPNTAAETPSKRVATDVVSPQISPVSSPVNPFPAYSPSKAKPAPKSMGSVDNVLALLKGGMSEALIIKTLQKNNQPINLAPANMVRLKDAKASDYLVSVMMNPSSPSAPTAATTSVATVPPVTPSSVTTAPVVIPSHMQTPTPVVDAQSQKKRVAVDSFDYSAVMTTVQAVFKTNADIGKGIQSMMVTRLGKDNKVVVVDRSKLKQVLAEQDMTAGNRFKQGSGSRIGRVSGADAILAGDIVIFGRDDKKKGGSAAAFGRFCTFCGVGAAIAASSKEEKAVVAINYRLIDAETTEVIATGEARGESLRKSKDFMGALAKAFGGGRAVDFDVTGGNFTETIVGEAAQDCVTKLAAELDKQAASMKKRVREVDATVVDVQGNSLMISAGSAEGVNVGEVFEILESIREVKDPITGELLDRVTEKRGEMVISTVRDKVSFGNYTGVPAKVRFIARKKVAPRE